MKWLIPGVFLVFLTISETSVLLHRDNTNVLLYEESVCPPPEQISPCTCFKNPLNNYRVTAQCQNFSDAEDLKDIFTKNPNWNLQDVHIDRAVMPYLPALMLEKAVFQSLNISSTTLVTLFDQTPVTTPELNLYMYNLTILRGFQWSSIARANLLELGAWHTDIKNFGSDFKENIPIKVQRLWFENTKTSRITDKAFENLKDLQILTISHGSIKVISRDMFPRPWKITFIDFSFQKIEVLPEDIFADMPNLGVFQFEGNLLKTLSSKAFIKSNVLYSFVGNPINCDCEMKWITEPGKIIPLLFKGECSEPESFKGKELASFKSEDFRFCA